MDLVFLWLMTVVAGFWIFKKFKELQTLPPGPWGLPIIGYLPFLNREYPHLTLTKLAKVYGPIYGIKMGNVYTVVLSDHKLVREAFSKEAFSGRAPLYLTHGIMQGKGIICAEGALWKDQRKLLTTWLKSFGMVKHSVTRNKLEKRIANGAFDLLEKLNKTEGPVDFTTLLTDSLGNVVNEIIFGFKYPSDDKTWVWIRDIQEEGCHDMGVAGIVNFLPFIRFLSPSTRTIINTVKRGQKQSHALYASIIARRRKMLGMPRPEGAENPGEEEPHPEGLVKCVKYSSYSSDNEEHFFDPNTLLPTEGECILDNFLVEQKKRFDSSDPMARFMTDDQMSFLLADMFGAGLDTTAVTLAWFLVYMAKYPQEQTKIRNEIRFVYPEESDVDCSRLPQLMAAICETQRIRSIVPVGIPHGCLESTYLGDYRVPKGSMVIPLQWAIHMDPKVWENPDEFNPSRFLDSDGNLLKPQEFIPFQTGKRMCPGDELSRMLACGFMARLLRSKQFSFADEEPSDEDMLGTVGVTLAPPEVLYRVESIS